MTTVQVERRKSDGDYGNRMMMLTAELGEGEDVGTALDQLAALASAGIERAVQADEEREEAARLARQVALERRLQERRQAGQATSAAASDQVEPVEPPF